MKTNFTFGIPEIDHLTGHQIENMSFLLFTGNDDEGMCSFLAEMKKSQGRHAEKESNRWQFIQADLKNPNLTDEIAGGFKTGADFEKQNIACVIENVSGISREEEMQRLKNDVLAMKNMEQKNGLLLIAVLYEGILPASFENRLKHLADCYFQFEMTQKYTDFERVLSIWKYKESNAGGKILRYTLQDGRIQIENKKRIY